MVFSDLKFIYIFLPVFFLLALAGAACGLLLYAAGSALQILCDIRGAVKDKLR